MSAATSKGENEESNGVAPITVDLEFETLVFESREAIRKETDNGDKWGKNSLPQMRGEQF